MQTIANKAMTVLDARLAVEKRWSRKRLEQTLTFQTFLQFHSDPVPKPCSSRFRSGKWSKLKEIPCATRRIHSFFQGFQGSGKSLESPNLNRSYSSRHRCVLNLVDSIATHSPLAIHSFPMHSVKLCPMFRQTNIAWLLDVACSSPLYPIVLFQWLSSYNVSLPSYKSVYISCNFKPKHYPSYVHRLSYRWGPHFVPLIFVVYPSSYL